MPGGRLSHEDRLAIAAGLTDGHGYAEIARRLDRPTSTISREIARNGGAHGYRADHAHYATSSRARRRRPTATMEEPAEVDAYGRDPQAVREFAERFAATMVDTGVPRMAARVLAHLYTADSPSLTAAELVRHLQVSHASISKAIGYLEGVELVRREPDDRGGRHEHYLIAEDVWIQAWKTSARANANWATTARQGAELLQPSTPAGARLEQMSQFFQQLSNDMSGGPAAGAAEDAMTVLAALFHAARPLTALQLATALDWPTDRVTAALETAHAYKDFTDPLVLRTAGTATYTVDASPNRLTPTQRTALKA